MKNTVFFLIALISMPAAAQNSGFFGKTHFAEFSGIGNFNAGIFAFDSYYRQSGNGLEKGRDLFNGGVNLAAGIALKRNLALTIESGWWSFNVAGPTYFNYVTPAYSYSNTAYIRHEKLDARTFSIMPIIEFGGRKDLLPIGISHQVGVGYTSSRFVEKVYRVEPENSDPIYYYDENWVYYEVEAQHFIDSIGEARGGFVNFNTFKGVTLLYGLKVRTPVTKNILINYGLRYTLNVGSRSATGNEDDPESWSQDAIRERRFRSLIGLTLGLTYVF